MQHWKKTEAGRGVRIEVLSPHVPHIREHLKHKPVGCAPDDLLDAALSARRKCRGEAGCVCVPQLDARGLLVEMVY
jgi:hypothetical protein